MDLLFKKYASPFLLLDGFIRTCRFTEFVIKFSDITQTDQMWEVYLHKVFDQTWESFKASVTEENNRIRMQQTTDEQIEATIRDSMNILNHFRI